VVRVKRFFYGFFALILPIKRMARDVGHPVFLFA
jgi:hypothetical protein